MTCKLRPVVLLPLLVLACTDGPTAGTSAADGSSTASPGTSESTSTPSPESSTTIVDEAGESTAAPGSSSSPQGSSTEGGPEGGPGSIRLDVAAFPDLPPAVCGGNSGSPSFSYLWAANSTQGTISKIDTESVTEVGRYIVRPDSNGNPSRTSVSLSGHVAVANRSGGVTKVYATDEYCQNSNGQAGIQTSTGNTALPWGTEECVAWHTPFNYESQRPVAWVQGEWNPNSCAWENERVWTSGRGGSLDVLLLDGDTGVVLDQVTVLGMMQDFYGIYGGAVDAEGNFWGSQLGGGQLVRVDVDTLDYDVFNTPPEGSWYGMTVDVDGFVWLCSWVVGRFDPTTETWATATVNGGAGCMADASEGGLLWMADGGGGLVGVNRQTLAVEAQWQLPGSYGVSIDFQGYVWTVEYGDSAHRLDPVTGTVVSYNGLVDAYTYSDMTGYALTAVGGGVPEN